MSTRPRLVSQPTPNTDIGLPSWLKNAEVRFLRIRQQGVRLGDLHTDDHRELGRHATAHRWHRPFPGYVCPSPDPEAQAYERERTAALHLIDYVDRRRTDRARSKHVALAGQSAAMLLGLPLVHGHPSYVVRQVGPASSSGRTANTRTFRSPAEPETVELAGIMVSSPAQVVVDLARFATVEDALACANFVLHRELATREQIETIAGQLQRVKGVGNIRRVLRLMDGRIESVGESLTLLRLDDFSLLPVKPQVWVQLRDRTYRLDFLDLARKIAYEFDGRAKMFTPSMLKDGDLRAAISHETDRDRHLRAIGIDPLHLVWSDVKTREGFENWLADARARGVRI